MRVPLYSTAPNIPLLLRNANAPYSPDNGATLTVQIRKPGGTWQTPVGTVVGIGNGFYELQAKAADRDTVGPVYVAVVSSTNPNDFLPDTVYEVEPAPPPPPPIPPVIQQTINGGLSAGDSTNLANVAAYLKLLVNATVKTSEQVP